MDNAVNKSMTFINPQIYLSLLIIVFNVLTEPRPLHKRTKGRRNGRVAEANKNAGKWKEYISMQDHTRE